MDEDLHFGQPARDEGRPSFVAPHEAGAGRAATSWGSDPSHIPDEVRFHEPSPASGTLLETIKESGVEPAIVREVLQQYAGTGPSHSSSDLAALDAQHLPEADAELRGLWGDKFDDNVGSLHALINGMGADGQAILEARRADGRALMNDPAVVMRLLAVAQRPGPKGDAKTSTKLQRAEIEDVLRSNRQQYDRDPVMQARYRELIARDLANG